MTLYALMTSDLYHLPHTTVSKTTHIIHSATGDCLLITD